jgi:putative transposase
MDRWAAADLLREVCNERFGSVETAVAAGLALRYDGGPCFCSHHYQAEIDFLGITRSPAFHYEPETNGCVEKFLQTLKEQVLWIERFDTLDELRIRIRKFAVDFNEHWLLERHGYRTPRQARDALRQPAMRDPQSTVEPSAALAIAGALAVPPRAAPTLRSRPA